MTIISVDFKKANTTETIPSNTCTIEYTGTNHPQDKGNGILDWNAARGKGSYVYWVNKDGIFQM